MSFHRIKNHAFVLLRRHRKLAIIINILMAISSVFFINYSYICKYLTSSILSFLFVVVVIFCGFFAVSRIFKDMHNKQFCDIELSLPMKASERYFAKLISVFFIHILPIVFWLIFSFVVSMTVISNSHNDLYSDNVAEFWAYFAAILSAAFFTDAVAVFWSCCCGTSAENVYFSIITSCSLTALPLGVVDTIIPYLMGIEANDIDKYACFWSYSTMLLGIGYEKYIPFSCINIAISIAVMLLCLLIYKKRDGRTVGFTVVYKSAFELMMFLGAFMLLLWFTRSGSIGIGIIFALAASIIIRLIVCRRKVRFKGFMMWLVKFAACFAVYIALSAVLYFAGGVWADNYVPKLDTEYTNKLTVRYYSYDSDDDDYYYESNTRHYDSYTWTVSEDVSEDDMKKIMEIVRSNGTFNERSVSGFIDIMENGYSYYSYYYSGYQQSDDKTVYVNFYAQDSDAPDSYYVSIDLEIDSRDNYSNLVDELDSLPCLDIEIDLSIQ